MAKRIPKTLKKVIIKTLFSTKESLPSGAISDRVNNDPDLPASMKKTPKQIAYMMNVLSREFPEIVEVELLSANGTNHHGNERFKKQFRILT